MILHPPFGLTWREYAEILGEDDGRPDNAAEPQEEEHEPFACGLCGGLVVWVPGDGPGWCEGGYRCGRCDTPHNLDGTLYEFPADAEPIRGEWV